MQTAGGAKRTPQETYLRIALRSGRAPRRIQRMGRPRKLDQHETGAPWPKASLEPSIREVIYNHDDLRVSFNLRSHEAGFMLQAIQDTTF